MTPRGMAIVRRDDGYAWDVSFEGDPRLPRYGIATTFALAYAALHWHVAIETVPAFLTDKASDDPRLDAAAAAICERRNRADWPCNGLDFDVEMARVALAASDASGI
jgi:hypothetical protein